MRHAWRFIAGFMCAVCLITQPDSLGAQPKPVGPGVSDALDSLRAMRGASLTVSLITYGPTDVFYERFGHAALAFRDSITGQDVAYNWGMFDFNQPRFLTRFLTGETSYSMAGYSTAMFNSIYQGDDRSIREQTLALTAVERGALLEFVGWNALDENKFYRYDYYRDNCATRIRDALDWVLRGRLHTALAVPGSGRTWRDETARVLASMLPYYLGIELALGRRADEPLTRWDEEFLPEHMATHYATLSLPSLVDGTPYNFVAHDSVVYASTRPPLPTNPPSYIVLAVLVGLTLASLVASIADARSNAAHLTLAIAVAIWYGVCGTLGTALLLAGTVTKHAPYMGANASLFAIHPLILVAAILVPVSFLRGRRSTAANGISMVVAGLSVCGLVLQLMPAFRQGSGVIFALVVPVHVAIAFAVSRLSENGTTTPAPKPADAAKLAA